MAENIEGTKFSFGYDWRWYVPVVLAVFLIGSFTTQWFRDKKLEQRKLVQLQGEFAQNIDRAKRATADPCATVFFELVRPPAGLDVQSIPIMMGQKIESESLDPAAYSLRPKGDKTELWIHVATPLGADEPKKIGEKYSPDSRYCRGR